MKGKEKKGKGREGREGKRRERKGRERKGRGGEGRDRKGEKISLSVYKLVLCAFTEPKEQSGVKALVFSEHTSCPRHAHGFLDSLVYACSFQGPYCSKKLSLQLFLPGCWSFIFAFIVIFCPWQ